MNILVCNDDGIFSEGLNTLALMLLKKGHNVLIVAPDGNRSAFSHSLSVYREITVEKRELPAEFAGFSGEKCEAYAVGGTPADCVKFAAHGLNKKIDLVCSGINQGSNLGSELLYSGTVACGLEANELGYKSIAFSVTAHKDLKFAAAGEFLSEIFERLCDFADIGYCLNVNVPNLEKSEIKGVKVTKTGIQLYSDGYVKTENGGYMLVGVPKEHDLNEPDCDVEWNRAGYVTVTPLSRDKTDRAALEIVKDRF